MLRGGKIQDSGQQPYETSQQGSAAGWGVNSSTPEFRGNVASHDVMITKQESTGR